MPLDVAITAAEVRTALAPDLDGTWNALLAGESAVGPIVGFDASGFGDVRAAQIWREPEQPEDDPALRILGPHGRLLDSLALDVHAAARLADLPRERIGLFVGMGMVDAPAHDLAQAVLASRTAAGDLDLAAFFGGGYRAVHPLWPLTMLNNVAVGQVAMDLDLRGDNLVLASDADAGLRAMLEGARSVDTGSTDAVLTAGIGERVSPASLARVRLRERLTPEAAPGEGGAAFVFEGRTAAEARGCRVLGILRGGATTFGRVAGRAAPDVAAIARAAVAAIAEAEVPPDEVDLVLLPGGQTAAEDDAARAGLAAARFSNCVRLRAFDGIGHPGAASPSIHLALALRLLGAGGAPLPFDGGEHLRRAAEAEPPRPYRALIMAAGSSGGAGALMVEVPA